MASELKKLYVLDTNVLLADPMAIYAFEDHEVIIPSVVLEELDGKKRLTDDLGRNARMVSRQLDELRLTGHLFEGVDLPNGGVLRVELNHRNTDRIGSWFQAITNDNRILAVALNLQIEEQEKPIEDQKLIIVVSDDTLVRVKADAIGIAAEGYKRGKVVALNELYTGKQEILVHPGVINEVYNKQILSVELLKEELYTAGETVPNLYPNQFIVLKDNIRQSQSAMLRVDAQGKTLKPMFYGSDEVWGLRPKNTEQRMALELLLDANVPIVTISGRAGCGKSQPLSEPVLTPTGFVDMGSIKPNDFVIGSNGKPTRVLSIHPQGELDVYQVNFSDGTFTRCSKDHLWYTKTAQERDGHKDGKVRTTEEIIGSIRYGKNNEKRNHSIPIVEPVEFEKQELKVDPYLLGLLLGNGMLNYQVGFSTNESELVESISRLLPNNVEMIYKSKYDYKFRMKEKKVGQKNTLKELLNELNLYGLKSIQKFIPDMYKFNTVENRVAILQGLMDTDGTVDKVTKTVSFSSSSKQLAEDVLFLVQSLGGTATITSKIPKYIHNNENRLGHLAYRVWMKLPNEIQPFRLERKKTMIKPFTKYFPIRFIESVVHVGKEQCQCIAVEAEDHLYVTKDFIVTHNTLLALAAALHQVEDEHKYNKLLVARPVIPMGKDIGYLPGDKDEKLRPWMQPIYDNLEFLFNTRKPGDLDRILSGMGDRIQVEALTYIRGRSIPGQFIIVDEAQNLSKHEVKTIVTRVGEGSKIVLVGDPEQIDHPYLDASSNGLTYVIEKMKEHGIAGHIQLTKGERSSLAQIAADIL